MGDFPTFFLMGFDHILSLDGLDHILFILTLCAAYRVDQLKNILILVTAFTVGHSLTLILAGFELISVDAYWIELLIPITIMMTSLYNISVSQKDGYRRNKISINYGLAAFFGLIHGLGFSNSFKELMMGIQEFAVPLVSFNIGIELGQIIIVLILMVILFLFERLFAIKHHSWNLYLSGAGAGVAVLFIIERI